MFKFLVDDGNRIFAPLSSQWYIETFEEQDMTFFDNFSTDQLSVAHRGFRSHYPENTLSAFIASVGRCNLIELDIQLSKDKVPMVIHDPTLDRTSDGKTNSNQSVTGSLKVNEWTVSQLKTLDMGSWFIQDDPFETIANKTVSLGELNSKLPQTIMTLEEVLRHPKLRHIPINVEIKDHAGTPNDKIVATRVVEIIQATYSEKRVLLSSFNHDYLLTSQAICPSMSTAVLRKKTHPANIIEYLRTVGATAYHPYDKITDKALIQDLRAAGFWVNVFTVNDKKRQQYLFSAGATGIITDFPELECQSPEYQ